MSITPSNPFLSGTLAPDFTLPDTVSGTDLSLQNVRGELGTVITFICNHCPFVLHVNRELVKLAEDYQKKGISFAAISSNDISSYPADAPYFMQQVAEDLGYPFPYLYDESQEVAHAYNAACTPDFYVFDKDLKSVYHGQLDDSRPGNGIPVTGTSIRVVLEKLLNDQPYIGDQVPSIGCNIKWR